MLTYIEKVMPNLLRPAHIQIVKNSIYILGFLTQHLLDSGETLNVEIVIDEFTFLEWVKSLDFDVRISSEDHLT